MRRLLLFIQYAGQVCLGLAVIGLSAASQLGSVERAEADARVRSRSRPVPRASLRPEARLHSRGPSIP